MTSKKYTLIFVSMFGLFFIANLIIWYGFNGQSSKGADGHGDLLRMGNLHFVPSETTQVHYETPYTDFKTYVSTNSQETYDVLTIGDSFSNGGGGAAYQGELIQKFNLSVINLCIFPYYKYDVFTLFHILDKFGYLDRIQPKIIILECVERYTQTKSHLSDPSSPPKDYENDPLPTELSKTEDHENTSDRHQIFSNYMVKSNRIYLKDQKRFFRHSYRLSSSADRIPLTNDCFSANSRENQLIFMDEDLDYLEHPVDVNRVNDNLNRLAEMLHEKGIQLVFLSAPDKFDVYYPQLSDEWKAQWPENPFFDEMDAVQKNYIFIDSRKLLREAVASGEKDVYWSDDTHWSWKAHQIICAEIMRQIEASK